MVGVAVQAALVAAGALSGLAATPLSTAPTGPSLAPAAASPAGSPSTSLGSPGSQVTTRSGATASAAVVGPAGVLPHAVPVRSNLVHGTPRASWIPNGQVNALATDGTYVYLGGLFTGLLNPDATTQTQVHTRLARINLTTGVADASWKPSVDGAVRALAYDPATSTLFVGGTFANVGNSAGTLSARANLAAISTTTAATTLAMAPNPDDEVRALLVDSGEVVVGGAFKNIAGSAQKHLAKLVTSSGALDGSFTPNVGGGDVYTVTRPAGRNFYALGGSFTTLGGSGHLYIGMVNRSSGAASSWSVSALCTPGDFCPVLSLASNAGQVFAAISGPGGLTAAYSFSTGTRQWVIVADGNSQALATYGAEVFVGGHFSPNFGGETRQTLAAVTAATGAIDPTFRPSAKSAFPGTEALLVTPVGLVAAGTQLNIGGTVQSRFAIFTATQTLPYSQHPPGPSLGGSVIPRR